MHVVVVFLEYEGHEFGVHDHVEVWDLCLDFEGESVSGRDVETLCVVGFNWVNCSYDCFVVLCFRFQRVTSRGHFDEAIEDDKEFHEIGGNSLASDIFLTLATDFLTEAPALEHHFLNLARPNCEAPVLRSL